MLFWTFPSRTVGVVQKEGWSSLDKDIVYPTSVINLWLLRRNRGAAFKKEFEDKDSWHDDRSVLSDQIPILKSQIMIFPSNGASA